MAAGASAATLHPSTPRAAAPQLAATPAAEAVPFSCGPQELQTRLERRTCAK